MIALRNALLVACLFLACVAGLQVTFLLAQAGAAANDLHDRSMQALADLDATLAVIHGAALEQRRYYKATGKAMTIATMRAARLIEQTDARLERIAQEIEATAQESRRDMHEAGQVLHYLGTQIDAVGYETQITLAAGRGTLLNLERLAGDPALVRAASNLERSSANLEKFTAASAEAAGHLRDMLSPRKKSFWRWLLEIGLPRPTVPVR